MAQEVLEPNGLLGLNMNYGAYVSWIASQIATEQRTPQEELALKMIGNMDLQIVESIDVRPDGLSLDARMVVH